MLRLDDQVEEVEGDVCYHEGSGVNYSRSHRQASNLATMTTFVLEVPGPRLDSAR